MKNKIVTRMLACLMASAILATTVAGGVVLQPVTVMAEETGGVQASAKYTFDVASTWDNNKGKENNVSLTTLDVPKEGTTLQMDVLLPKDATFTGSMKTVGVLRLGTNWDWVQSKVIPELKAEDFKDEVTIDGTEYKKASVSIEFGANVGANVAGKWNESVAFKTAVTEAVSAVTVQFAGCQCDYSGTIAIANAKLVEPENVEVAPTDPITVASFQENIKGWESEAGWNYSHGKENPVKNDTTPTETADVSWDEASQSLKMSLDYSKDTGTGWSEAKVTGTFNPVNISNYNIVTFKLRYPSSMDSIRTKLFMKSTDGTEILNAEGSFRSKTVEAAGDGWSTVTIRGEIKPQAKSVSSLTIGIVGPYADLREVYIDDVTFGQLDASEDYVQITEDVQTAGDQAGLNNMAKEVKLVDSNATASAKALAAYLTGLRKDDKVLFGHQNSTFRSVRDNGKTSDIKDITGSEAGLFGIDTLALAGTECASENPLEASIEASKKAYEGGSIISLSCHMPNFTNAKITATGDAKHPYNFSKCDFSESKDLTPCADYILEGGEYNAQYNAYLDIIADYALKLQEANVPILFRPFHENSGGWFWWGTSTSADSYRAIWRYMVNYLQAKGVHNLLYVYSPNGPIDSESDYLSRYPGDAYVDVLGFDYYDDYADVSKYTGKTYFEALAKSCDVVAGLADKKAKIPAIAETGIRITGAGKDSLMVSGNPTKDKDWYNQVVNTAVEHDIPYFLLWANFDSENFFVPYKYSDTMGQEMINDFIKAYNNDHSIFGNGTNFYGDNGAISKAGEITLTGYSSNVGGYLISPKNYAVIKDACELKASVKNAAKVTFEIRTSETDDKPLVIEGTKSENSDVYTAQLTANKLAAIPKTGTGVITVVAYGENDTTGTSLGTAKFINFNQDAAVMPSRVFDNFEYYYGNDGLMQTKYGTHNSAAGCSSSVSLDAVNKVEGSYGCAFNYTLSYKGSEAWTGGLGRTFDNKDFSDYNALSMWVKPDGNGQKMVIQLKDSNGKEYEAYLTEFVKGTKAQYVTIPFASFKAKGGTDSISASDIAGYFLWCNTIPENFAEKDADGNYTVSGSIVFDDIKAVKVSNADLAKIGEGKTFLTTDAPLTDLSSASQGGSTSGSGSSSVSGGSSAADTTVTNPDGSKTETTVSTNPDGSKTQTTVTTKPDGSKVKTVATANKDGSTVTVTTTTDSKGSTSVKAEVVKTGTKSAAGTKGKISSDVAAQITEAAGTTDVVITQKVVDKNGKTAYIVSVNAKDLSAGKKLTLVKYNKKTGKYTLYNKKTYKVTDAGVSQTIKDSGSYQLISEADAAKLVKEILATVKPAKKSKTVKEGNAASFAWSKELDTANVSKITYSSTDNSIAKIGKNGKITAKKAGKVTLKATVTLKNGKKKVVSMKLSVRAK